MESLNSNSQERELYQLQQMQHKAKESCMKSFRLLQSHLQVLSYNDLKINGCFERAFATLFGQDVQTFTGIMLLNLDQLEKQLDKDEFQGDRSMTAFCVINKQFQKFIDWQYFLDYDSEMTEEYFAKYTGFIVKQFRDKLIQHMENVKKFVAERARHQRQFERRVNNRQMQTQESKIDTGSALDVDPGKALDASLVVTECSGTKSDKHDTSNSSRTYLTHAVDADIRPVDDQVPFAEDAEQYQAKIPLLKAELVKSKEMIEKETMEAHCVNMELKYQNQALKDGQHGQILNETSNKIKIKKEIEVLETINIKLEHSVAKLLAENEKLNKENEHLKQTYKELYDSIKKTRVQNKDNSTPHYLPKVREYVLAKPYHVISPGSSRNSQEESYGSNDMAHNHYLEEARKKTQERNRNSKPSVMHTTSLQNTTNRSKQKPKSNNQTSRSFPVSKSSGVTSDSVPL
ncbi:hypothetical protein Tco_1118307, partial [Tanacetum coccineum]